MRIVIFGYTGLLGEGILAYLKKNTSYDIICVGRNNKPILKKNSSIKYLKWDFATFTKSNLQFLNKADVIINCVGKINNSKKDLQYLNVTFLKKLTRYISQYKLEIRLIHLSSVSVYGKVQDYIGQSKTIYENSNLKANSLYSKSKLNGDLLIQNSIKKTNKNFTYTILRISNAFGKTNNSNLYKFVLLFLKLRICIQSSAKVMYNFVNTNDVAQAAKLVISRLHVSKNKIYIVSDDCRQNLIYEKIYKKKFTKFVFPISLIKFLIFFIPMPNKLFQFFLNISSEVSYSNKKIVRELKFKPRYSLLKCIKSLNG